MLEQVAAILAGYLFSIVVGHWATSALMAAAWNSALRGSGQAGAGPGAHAEIREAIGLVERVLYTAAWQVGAHWFLGLWLGLKAAGKVRGWDEAPAGPGKTGGRAGFHLFLIGSAVSLIYGVVGAMMISQLNRDSWALALLAGAGTVGATLGLRWFLARPRS
jgi:hypothetical protein